MKAVQVLLVIASCSLVAQASLANVAKGALKDEVINYMQLLAEITKDKIDSIQDLSVNTLKLIKQDTSSNMIQLNKDMDKMVADAIQKVMAMNCEPDTASELMKLRELPTDRFQDCIQFTGDLVDFEKYLYNISSELGTVETLICNAIIDATSCTGSVLEEIHCVTTYLIEYIERFKNDTDGLQHLIEEIEAHATIVKADLLKCLFGAKSSVQVNINDIIKRKCVKSLI